MASTILSSAKHGAYVAIGLYVAMVLVVSLSAQSQRITQAPIQVAYPAIQFEHVQHASAEHSDVAGAVGV
ncbi:TonB system transport protein TonB [Pseudomonas sp. FW306-02-F02-AA]|jgi:hypothetical protein|uniref:Uncharacterized protein n=1 Tax=Pseudomonas fluorescens TaxID=294 RepID=A0A0N7H0S0_PSEFL|nr:MULTISPECIES: hypothetical protein [Pseudomonas]ALI03916.1 hypothetical protein AO353_23660 [Pseudomonas fluorescens]PMZ04844.1 TonB system transport protein TonB [Pseudomonas sp. FW306-02-F02-AB]PMZ12008.1 TonB system transport protein TonB [Pseudomonas sp. FW306-02-H06C]PMZ17769.1 TonB system transport protein TonB [Pseudomonas sp. FW306-02-F02-AA]PMZ23801.1 TonB system transport protein TonB [Pseudomonas sp. FW306-02-F08-AA]